jgi:predicted nucleic acid-binding protein
MPTEPRIYLDSCCFIEMAKHDLHAINSIPDSDIWYYRKLLEASRNGDIKVFTSLLTISECLHVKSKNDKVILNDEVKRLFTGILTSGRSGVTSIQPSLFIIERARDLNWIYNLSLRAMDRLHVASALEVGCSEFITTDGGIHSKSQELNDQGLAIIYARNTTVLPAEYRQLALL